MPDAPIADDADTRADDVGQCDCCSEMVPQEDIGRVVAHGIETYACARCRGEDNARDTTPPG